MGCYTLPIIQAQIPHSGATSGIAKGVRFGLTQLITNAVWLVGRSGKEKGWFYFPPRVAEGGSRNLFTSGPFSIKGWKDKFFFVDETKWGRRDGEVEELNRWKGKKANPIKYQLREGERTKWKDWRGVGKRSDGNFNYVLLCKRNQLIEVGDLALREVGIVTHRKGKSFVPFLRQKSSFFNSGKTIAKRFIDSTFLEVDLQKANEELNTIGGASVIRHALEVKAWDCILEELAIAKKAAELEEKKRKKCEEKLATRENKLADMKKKVVLAIHNAKVKAQNSEVDVTNITFGSKEARVKENGDNKAAEFRPEITLKLERDEARKTILPLKLEFEFVAVDEKEAEVPKDAEVVDNTQNEEVDQQHQVIN
ncbi:hypothetical protein SLEP1_g12339 [Rubroshorea leprosula]|uniref:Uncharacterized protein n=1 Tax=Rubroshorea leprosula TaxID=152421 RepID=A0AAV5IK77_9ROSI|nr:hypothetical protein SLEP1_g12339 [Rubroshorea leprosula]